MNWGLQLYSIREELKRDFYGTLEQVARLGVRTLEFGGAYGPDSPPELRHNLDGLGFQTVAAHVGLADLEGQFEREVERLHTLGTRYAVVPWWKAEDEAGWPDLFQRLAALREKLESQGIKLAYHNHAHEISTRLGAKTVLERMAEAVPGLLLELDVAWVLAGGEAPQQYLQTYSGRLPLLHLKDVKSSADGWQTVELGSGEVPLEDCLVLSRPAGVECVLIEQDHSGIGPLESLRRNVAYLKERLG